MTSREQNPFNQLLPLLIQTGVGILILLIVWLIVDNLPMLEKIDFPLEFTLSQLMGAILVTLIIGVLINFGHQAEVRMRTIMPSFPQSGSLLKLFIYMLSIFFAYAAFGPLLLPYMDKVDLDWIYHLLFLLLVFVILGLLGYSLYIHLDKIIPLFSSQGWASSMAAPEAAGGAVCDKCGASHKSDATFCTSCGQKLAPGEKAEPARCSRCKAELKPGARFCPGCGSPVTAETTGSVSTKSTAPPPAETPAHSCGSCKTVLKEDARFCPSCGAAQP